DGRGRDHQEEAAAGGNLCLSRRAACLLQRRPRELPQGRRRSWVEAHAGISCEAYEEMKFVFIRSFPRKRESRILCSGSPLSRGRAEDVACLKPPLLRPVSFDLYRGPLRRTRLAS